MRNTSVNSTLWKASPGTRTAAKKIGFRSASHRSISCCETRLTRLMWIRKQKRKSSCSASFPSNGGDLPKLRKSLSSYASKCSIGKSCAFPRISGSSPTWLRHHERPQDDSMDVLFFSSPLVEMNLDSRRVLVQSVHADCNVHYTNHICVSLGEIRGILCQTVKNK